MAVDAGDGDTLELALAELREEPLGEVEPGRGSRHEVELDARMLLDPGLHLGMLGGGVVIHDGVKR